MRLSFFLILFGAGALFPNPLDYYKNHFQKRPKHKLADTLFAKTIWYQKVSHLVIEEYNGISKVTLLMIAPRHDTYRSQNYPLYWEFQNQAQARTKFFFIDNFLKNNGVMRIHLKGNKIVKEEILFAGQTPKVSDLQK